MIGTECWFSLAGLLKGGYARFVDRVFLEHCVATIDQPACPSNRCVKASLTGLELFNSKDLAVVF